MEYPSRSSSNSQTRLEPQEQKFVTDMPRIRNAVDMRGLPFFTVNSFKDPRLCA
jgi:hypothetical protein